MAETNADQSAFVESLMVWIHDRPHMYCMLAGELDTLLNFLHVIWAHQTNREQEHRNAMEACGMQTCGLLRQKDRHKRVDLKDEVTQRILGFWSSVNQILDIRVRIEVGQAEDPSPLAGEGARSADEG